ncbi:MAG: hypothetical protein ACLUVC_04675 [Longibaculum sp.]
MVFNFRWFNKNFFPNINNKDLIIHQYQYKLLDDNYYIYAEDRNLGKKKYKLDESNHLIFHSIGNNFNTNIEYNDNNVKIEFKTEKVTFNKIYNYEMNSNNKLSTAHIEEKDLFENGSTNHIKTDIKYYYDNNNEIIKIVKDFYDLNSDKNNYIQETINFYYYNYYGKNIVYEQAESVSPINEIEITKAVYFKEDRKTDLLSELGIRINGIYTKDIVDILVGYDKYYHYNLDRVLYLESTNILQQNIDKESIKFIYDRDNHIQGIIKNRNDKTEKEYKILFKNNKYYILENDDFDKIEQYLSNVNKLEKTDKITLNSEKKYAIINELEISNSEIIKTERIINQNDKLYQEIKNFNYNENYINDILNNFDKYFLKKEEEKERQEEKKEEKEYQEELKEQEDKLIKDDYSNCIKIINYIESNYDNINANIYERAYNDYKKINWCSSRSMDMKAELSVILMELQSIPEGMKSVDDLKQSIENFKNDWGK